MPQAAPIACSLWCYAARGLTTPATPTIVPRSWIGKPRGTTRQFGRWLISWLLGTFAGYGDRLGRLFATYGITVGSLALIMLGATFQAGTAISLDTIRAPSC